MDLIEKTDQEHRVICAERRYMQPWKYPGNDGPELEKKIAAILKEKSSRAKTLRVTLPAQDWKEERVPNQCIKICPWHCSQWQ